MTKPSVPIQKPCLMHCILDLELIAPVAEPLQRNPPCK